MYREKLVFSASTFRVARGLWLVTL